MFLSSHVLAEVEALCGRVGILRSGRLVEVGSLDSMRLRSALTVEASFGGRPVPDVRQVPGVWRCHRRGGYPALPGRRARGSLLEVLAQAGASRLISREPSLEELFLTHYGSRHDAGAVQAQIGSTRGRGAGATVSRLAFRRTWKGAVTVAAATSWSP